MKTMDRDRKRIVTMQFKDVFDHIGHTGVYQVLFFLMMGLFSVFNGMHSMSANFFAGHMDHWCAIPRLENFSFDTQKYVGVPLSDDGEYDSCSMYDLDYGSLTDEDIIHWNSTLIENSTTIECTSWVFDQSEFVSTIYKKFGLVCSKRWLSNFTSTMYMAGLFFGSLLSGFISDRYGRRLPFLIGALGYFLFGLLQAVAPNYVAFVIFRFFVAFSNRFTKLCSYILQIELLGPKHNEKFVICSSMFFALGTMLVSCIAYGIRDVDKLIITISLPMLCAIPLIWLIPESPRWLVAKERYNEANKILKVIAEINRRSFPDDVIWEKPATVEKGTCADVCQSSVLRLNLALFYVDWFTVALIYYGVSFNAAAFGNVFLNTFLMGVIELPAIAICYFCITYGGRRWANVGGFLGAGLSSLACVPVLLIDPERQGLLTALSTMGKGCITFSFTCAYFYTSEMFPTPVRHISLGTSSTIARVGSMISPFMGSSLEGIWRPMPSVIFGSLATITGCLVSFLPEAKGHPIPDTIEAAAEIGRNKKKRKDIRSSMVCEDNRKTPCMSLNVITPHRCRNPPTAGF